MVYSGPDYLFNSAVPFIYPCLVDNRYLLLLSYCKTADAVAFATFFFYDGTRPFLPAPRRKYSTKRAKSRIHTANQ
jgi:hypothetical protein